jgi:hypothetical protein
MRRQQLFLVAASLVPAILLAIALIGWDYYVRERERQTRDSLATAHALGAAVDAELNGVQSVLFALATSPSLEKEDFASFHRQASAALANQRFTNIVLLDDKLAQHVNTLRPFGAPLPAQGNPEQLRRALDGQPVITDLFLGPVAKRPLIAVGVPLHAKERYLLAAALTPERLGAILSQQPLPGGWVAAIFDRTGTIVARTHDAGRFVGHRGAPALVERMQSEREGAVQNTTLEGVPVVSVFSRSPSSGWTVAIGIPLEEFTRHLLYSIGRLFIVAFMALLVAGGLALLIARFLQMKD